MGDTTFDFDRVVIRRGSGCYKWDVPLHDDVIPLWVADMDFTAAPCILRALQQRLDHGVFGYEKVPTAFYDALTQWFEQRHHWHIDSSTVIYTTGVVPALSAIIKALTAPGERVMLLTPVYNCFFSSITNNNCATEECPLQVDDTTGMYVIDYDDLERRAAMPEVTMMVMCNPHNPGGRVWTPDELARVADICHRHNVVLVSDEIHCELVLNPACRYTPMASIAPQVITCVSPSKSFNTAGLQVACIVCPDDDQRARIDRAININEVCDINPFGTEAFIAAYRDGGPWIDALCRYLWGNYEMLRRHFAEHLPALRVMPPEGTYLAWVDIRATGLSSNDVTDRLLEQARVMVNSGTMYGAAGEGYIRINFATRRSLLQEALQRITPVLK